MSAKTNNRNRKNDTKLEKMHKVFGMKYVRRIEEKMTKKELAFKRGKSLLILIFFHLSS